jgi:hypothetical protein
MYTAFRGSVLQGQEESSVSRNPWTSAIATPTGSGTENASTIARRGAQDSEAKTAKTKAQDSSDSDSDVDISDLFGKSESRDKTS